jgi:hypothetical protein
VIDRAGAEIVDHLKHHTEHVRLLHHLQPRPFLAKEGKYVADRLPPFITSVRRLLNESRDRPGWADARGSTLVVLADALQTLGDQSGQNAPLQEAVDAYRAALQEYTRERVPLQWVTTQNNLGTALLTLGVRTHDRAKLEEARKAVNAAFDVFMHAGQEHYRHYFEDRLREIDRQLAAQ